MLLFCYMISSTSDNFVLTYSPILRAAAAASLVRFLSSTQRILKIDYKSAISKFCEVKRKCSFSKLDFLFVSLTIRIFLHQKV